jgi:hypothetical protein
MVRMLTGTITEASPDLGAIVGHTWGRDLPLGYIDLAGGGFLGPLAAGSGRVGHRAQILSLLDDDQVFAAPGWTGTTYPQFTPDAADDAEIGAWLRGRTERFGTGAHVDARLESMDRAGRLRSDALSWLSALELGRSPDALSMLDLAVNLLDARLCSAVLCDTRFDWDTHVGNAQQHAYYDLAFQGLDLLVQQLEQRGMLADTLVAVISEMTRTPRLNAGLGKDHWPHATAMLVGGGIGGGRVYGAYDADMESRKVDLATGEPTDSGELLRYDAFVAGVLEACDVDPGAWLPSVTPFRGFLGA